MRLLIKLPSKTIPQLTSTILPILLPNLEIANSWVIRYVQALVELDPKAKATLLLKIDLYIVSTIAILCLFCFIDWIYVKYFH